MTKTYAEYLLEAEQRSIARTGKLPYMPGIKLLVSRTGRVSVTRMATFEGGIKPKADPSPDGRKRFRAFVVNPDRQKKTYKPGKYKYKAPDKAAYAENKRRAIEMLGGKCSLCGGTDKLRFRIIERNTDGKRSLPVTNYLYTWSVGLEKAIRNSTLICHKHRIVSDEWLAAQKAAKHGG